MRIVYIDDEEYGISTFRRSFLLRDPSVEIKGFVPKFSIEDTYRLIFADGDVDAVITDHELSDSCDVDFTGADLVNFLLDKHPLLPCFVLTAFEDNAVRSDAVDVYHVYPKSILHSDNYTKQEHVVSFIDKVKGQIEKSRRKLASLESEHRELSSQMLCAGWTSEQEGRLIEIDGILEQQHAGTKISGFFKTRSHSTQVIDLIKVTKELLAEVKKDDSCS